MPYNSYASLEKGSFPGEQIETAIQDLKWQGSEAIVYLLKATSEEKNNEDTQVVVHKMYLQKT